MSDSIILPDSGDGSRRARRGASRPEPKRKEKNSKQKAPERSRETRQREPRTTDGRRRWPFIVLVLLLLAGAGTAWFVTRDSDSDSDKATTSNARVATTRATGLLIQRTNDGQLAGLTLLVDSGRGGDVMFVPPGTMVQAPSLGLVPLRETLDPSSHDLLVSTVENLLGTRVKTVADVTTDQLVDAVRPAAPLHLEVPAAVERRTGDRIETVFEAGPAEVSPEQIGDFLDLPAATDLDRLVRHQAFWEAWLAQLRSSARAAPPVASLPLAFREQLRRLAAGDVVYQVLPVKAVSGVDDLYQVERSRLDGVITRVLPGTPTWAQRITVQVLNGTGKPGAAQALVEPLVDAAARVALTGNADRFGYTKTQVLYYENSHANDARRVQAALGIGEVVKSRSAQRVVAVTVVVGTDFTPPAPGNTSTTRGVQP